MFASSATINMFSLWSFWPFKRFCPKASCSKCGESGHVDLDCETVNDPQPRLVEEVRPSESNVPARTVPLHREDGKDDFVTVAKKRRASAPRDPTSAPKVVALDTVVPVTEEPHRMKKRIKWFPITRMYFKVYSVVRALQIAVQCLLVLLNRV